jgi:hypothetical protein
MRGFNSDELFNRTIRGTVRVMSDGNIRWSFVSSVRMHDVNKQNSAYGSPLSSFRFQCITATTSGGSIVPSPLRISISDHAMTVRKVSRSAVYVARRALLAHGRVLVTIKVGSVTFTNHSSDTPPPILGDPSGR